jgi:hypothetical protein
MAEPVYATEMGQEITTEDVAAEIIKVVAFVLP